MNITQQIAASIGTALFSVLLTNELKDSKFVSAAAAIAEAHDRGPCRVLDMFGLSSSSSPTSRR